MRILSSFEVLLIVVDVPALLFHASMLFFILRQIAGKKEDFSSAFYRLFAAMGVIETIHMIDVSVHGRPLKWVVDWLVPARLNNVYYWRNLPYSPFWLGDKTSFLRERQTPKHGHE